MVIIARLMLVLIFTPLSTLACDKLIVSSNPNNAPISFVNQGELTGLGVKLFRRLIADLNTPIEITQPYPWKRVLRNSKHGDIDIIIGCLLYTS
ncbi:MAG: transporter substrate-binding domain-containing protein, partial [Pseudomonadales bacterium]|nr:transporter substrate-binding domain-containing protein [Pseudomonadales bacterium]